MAEYVRSLWAPQFQGLTRRDRRGCEYEAYLPDPLIGWQPSLPSDLAADIADAEAALIDLSGRGTRHVSLEGLARFLLRAESVASSKIEGLDAGPRRLLNAEAVLAQGGESADRVSVEVLGNIAAMESAVDLAVRKEQLSVVDLLDIHRVLMKRSSMPQTGGVVREQQNWIGGSSYNPCSASFVPPPPEYLADLLRDLMSYANGDEHSPVVQAAIAHAQFETIHPFVDGNGRTGRALIHVILRRRGLTPGFVPPISLVLATRSVDYISGLTAYRYAAPPDSAARSIAAQTWLHTFVSATLRACIDAEAYTVAIRDLTERWRADLGRVRKGSSLDLLLGVLPGVPLVTVESAARLIGRSAAATSGAINRLVSANILVQRNVGKQRYRIFEAPAVVDLFTSLERALASPAGDTVIAPPVRRVPRRPR